MSIHFDGQQIQGDAHSSISEQETSAQPVSSPSQPSPQPPPRSPRGKRERWFLVSALMVVLVIVLALGSVFVVQLSGQPGMHPTPLTPVPTTVATTKPAPTTPATPTATPPPAPSQPINAIWMSDAPTGWASTTTHLILHTSDAGKSWQWGAVHRM